MVAVRKTLRPSALSFTIGVKVGSVPGSSSTPKRTEQVVDGGGVRLPRTPTHASASTDRAAIPHRSAPRRLAACCRSAPSAPRRDDLAATAAPVRAWQGALEGFGELARGLKAIGGEFLQCTRDGSIDMAGNRLPLKG